MEPFKEMFSAELVTKLALLIKSEVKEFDDKKFIKSVLDDNWSARELKERMRHITNMLNRNLNLPFNDTIDLFIKIGVNFKGLFALVFPDYAEVYGMDNFNKSMEALEKFTVLCSSEFAVRPFIIKYHEKTIKQMIKWSKAENEHIRRFSSEGCRPRLPWGIVLPELKKDPSPILPIIENLLFDKSDYVRKSVANNLNDISKDNPAIVISLAEKHLGKNKNTDKLLKHALRTLLKKGDEKALNLFGFNGSNEVVLESVKSDKTKVTLNDTVEFKLIIKNSGTTTQKVRTEYLFEFPGKTDNHNKKIFQFKETEIKAGEWLELVKRHKFQHQSIRTLYPGDYYFTFILNGKQTEKLKIRLIQN